ncbi:MAG: choice-of-anchor D domain-containing protein [Chitinophagales bacterium]
MRKLYTLLLALLCIVVSTNLAIGQPWTEDFNSIASGTYGTGTINISGRTWTRSDAGNFSYANSNMGSYAFTINDDKSGAHITTPALNTCGTVTFDYAYINGNSTNVFQLQTSTDGISFSTVDTRTLGASANLSYVTYSYDVNNSSSTIYVRILSDNQNAHLFIEDFSVTAYSPTSPTITITPSALSGLDYVFGSGPSTPQSFTVEGSNLTNDIDLDISSSSEFEFSLSSGSGYTNSLTLTQSGGTVSTTSIYVRQKSGNAIGTYSDDIDITSTGATTQTVDLDGEVLAPPPANDLCSGAILLTPGISCSYTSGTNVNATDSGAGSPSCGSAGYSGGDVWYKVVVPSSGEITVTTSVNGSITDATMEIYSGTCGSLTVENCDDDSGSGTDDYMPIINETGLTPGDTIFIRVWEYGNNTFGTFNICVTSPCSAPSTQATNVSFSTITETSADVSWTNGDGSNRAVFIKQANTGTPSPSNNTTYSANTVFGSGDEIGSSGWYCIYNGTGTSTTVTGLTGATDYQVMVVEYNCAVGSEQYLTSTATGNPNSFTTATPTTPTIIVSTSALTDFGNQCINTTSTSQSYTVSGFNLTNNIIITAPTGFEIKAAGSGTYGPTVFLPFGGGTINDTTINVRFAPTTVTSFSSNITHTSTGATQQDVGVTGNGINSSGVVTTTVASSITANSASSGGNGTEGCNSITARGVVFDTSPNPIINATSDGTGSGSYSSALTGLSSNTTYYYRSYIVDITGTIYGNELNFTTLKDEPTNHPTAFSCGTTTTTTIPLTWTDATGGTVPDGYLIKWSLSSFAAIADPVDGTPEANGSTTQNITSGVGNFTATGLTSNTIYYFKIFPYTNSGTGIDYKTAATVQQTSCMTQNGPCLSDDFNSGYGNWTNGSGTYNNSGAGMSGNGIGFNTSNDDLITTSTLINPASIEFYGSASSAGADYTMTIQYSTSSSGPWTNATGGVLVANGLNTGDVTTSWQLFTITLNLTGNYYLRFIQNPRSGGSFYLDDVAVYCSAPTADIEVVGNAVTINDGSTTTSVTDDTEFGNIPAASGSISHTFTINNTGGVDLNLTGSPLVSLVDGTHFTISTQPGISTLTPTGVTSTTTFVITFDPASTGFKIDTVKIENDDPDEAPYNFVISGTGTNSNESDIITDGSFPYSSGVNINIPYLNYQDAGPFTNTTNNVGVYRFIVRDGGGSADADFLGTELNSITFSLGTTHINYIQNAALFDGNAMRANIPTINTGAGTIAFNGLSGANFTAADGGTLVLTLRVSFKNTVTDNEQLQFTITEATANVSGSAFTDPDAGGAVSSTTGDRNRIEVVATALNFVQQPSDASVNGTMSPAVTVSGVDINSNLDLDWTDNVNISSSGTMTGDPITSAAVAGIATFSGIVHTVDGTSYELTASHSTFSSVVSTTFNITTIVFNDGDYRTTGSSTWISGGAAPWDRLSGGTWSASTAPNYNTSNSVYIRAGHTVTSGGSWGNSVNLKIMDGGTFNANHPGTTNSIYIFDGGTLNVNASMQNNNAFDVEDNGTVNINNLTTNNSSLWNGDENFRPNSNFNIYEWGANNSTTSYRPLFNGSNVTTNSYNGYTAAFGNINVDLSASSEPNTFVLLSGGVTANLAHKNIYLYNPVLGRSIAVKSSGTSTSGIGGDLVVDNFFSPTDKVIFASSGSLDFTIKGDLQLDGATTVITTSSTSGTSTSVTIEGDINVTPSAVLNFSTTVAGGSPPPVAIINLKGDITVAGSGLLTNSNSSKAGEFNFVGTGDGLADATTQTIDIASTSSNENRYISFYAKKGSYVKQINRDFELGTNSALVVEDSAVYDFGFNGTTPLNLTISAGTSPGGTNFSSQQGSTLKITNPDGITTTALLGNVQTVPSNRSYNQTATFHYIGKVNQVTGNGISGGSTGKIIICDLLDNTVQLSFTNSTGITNATFISTTGGKLDIRKGQVIESTTAYITGTTGTLYMSPGTLYQIAKGNTTAVASNGDPIPRLVGATFPYVLTGGTVELAGSTAGNYFQTLRGSQLRPNYINVKFSGTNTLGVDYKNLTSTTEIENSLIVTDDAILDCINSAGIATSFIGDGAVVMDGGRLRIKKLNTPNPELNGIAADYDITGGTVEFYGSGNTESQLIRGTDDRTTPRTISYYNIELNADAANIDDYNVGLAAGIEIEGIMNVNSPTVFQTDRLDHIDGGGVFNVQAGGTYKYGDEYGITLGSSTAITAGAIRVSTNRTISNFPTTASYGFVGTTDMVTGNGLPTQAVNIYLDKTNSDNMVSLTNDLSITDTLDMDRGNILVGNNLLELGIDTSQTGILHYDYTFEPFVIGTMKRWFHASENAGDTTGLFPLGDTVYATTPDIHNRFAKVEYTSVKSAGGSLTARFINSPMSYLGIPINGIAPAGACATFDVTSTEDQGYWRIDDGDGLAGGNYDITCTGEGFDNIIDLCQITLLKRVNGGNWFENGNHQEPFYLNGNIQQPTVSRQGASGWSNYGFGGGDNNLLPVELVSFTAKNVNNNSLLNWITASELNNDYFEIEHSLNAIDFTKIGEVDGNGTINSENYYDHTHYAPPSGVNYYRLRQVDFNGEYSYSGIRSVLIEHSGQNTMEVVNTLAQNDLILQFLSTDNKRGNLVIYAANGQVISSRELNLASGGTQLLIDISELPSALYIVQWYSGDEIIEEKFIKKY